MDAPRSPRAQALVTYVLNSIDATFAHINAVSTDGDRDIVDITVEPQLPQDRVVAITYAEPIRLVFKVADDRAPSVLSLRDDFPVGLVHTNFEQGVNGRFLCIWEENWQDLRRTLTPQMLVERIRNWFTRTATGELHQAGQALEPLIPVASDTLIIPAGPPPAIWHPIAASKRNGIYTVVVDSKPAPGDKDSLRFPLFAHTIQPVVHGALRGRPEHLKALCDLVESMGIDLRRALGDWLSADEQLQENDRSPLILITVPKRRDDVAEVEAWENWAFMPTISLGDLGERLGRTCRDKGANRSTILILPEDPKPLEDVLLIGWRVVQRLDRATARVYAGNKAASDRKLVAIGAGAIGSNVIVDTMRAGVGTWTIIDNDVLLPHNTVRQAQVDCMVGDPKATSAEFMANQVLAEEGCKSIVANILDPGQEAEAVSDALANGDLVVDFSASPSVLGRIADAGSIARAASMFFNPDGNDLVVLVEGAGRSPRLDEIEAQYFLALAVHPQFRGHLSSARLDFIRYANACQDLSRPLPPWQVHTLCGIASGKLLVFLESAECMAHIWHLDVESGGVSPLRVQLENVHRCQFDGWRVTVTDGVLEQIREFRHASMPNETGGILIGSFDVARGVLHILAALPAPEDSQQAPTFFIRGSRDLKPRVDKWSARSAGVLHYVGEWHSHPDDSAARPSPDDEVVFEHLHAHLDSTGSPYVMMICGRDETWLRAGWQPYGCKEATVAHAR